MDFLGVGFAVGVNYPPPPAPPLPLCLTLFRIMLETWNIVSMYTHLLIQKINLFQYESCVRDFLVLFSDFVRLKVSIIENLNFTDHASGIRLPDCSKLAINWKNDHDVTICRHSVNIKLFWRSHVSLVKFCYCSKFHVNIITRSKVMAILVYKGLTKNPEIGNTLVWVLPNTWRLERVRDTKFGTNVCNVTECFKMPRLGYSFYCFWVIKVKPTEVRVKLPPIQIRVK